MGELFQPMHLIVLCFVFGVLAIGIVPFWQIFKKAGFPGPLALLMPVPLAGVVVLYIVAFSPWKLAPDSVTVQRQAPPVG
jgi:hypothetical protein